MYNRRTSNRLLYVLFIAQSLFSAGQIAVFTLVAIVAVRLSGTESVAGLPSSTLTFSQAFAAFPVAIIMGRFGRRLGLSLGYLVGTLGGLVGVIAILNGAFPLLLLSAVFIGMGRAGAEQGRFAAGETVPDVRDFLWSKVPAPGAVEGLGHVVGPEEAPALEALGPYPHVLRALETAHARTRDAAFRRSLAHLGR